MDDLILFPLLISYKDNDDNFGCKLIMFHNFLTAYRDLIPEKIFASLISFASFPVVEKYCKDL